MCLFLTQEGDFVWTDGEVVNFRNFGPGQPDNTGGNENCVEIEADGVYAEAHFGRRIVCIGMCHKMSFHIATTYPDVSFIQVRVAFCVKVAHVTLVCVFSCRLSVG